MTLIVRGIVRKGVVVPESPLPEGESVEIVVPDTTKLPAELNEELAAWNRASDQGSRSGRAYGRGDGAR